MAKIAIGGIATAVGVQSAFGTPNSTVAGLDHTGSPSLADGHVLGDKGSGDSESGISVPNIVGDYLPVAQVSASWTESADKFQKALAEGFTFSWVMQGNGDSGGTPGDADLSVIMPGLEAILECAGLTGAPGGKCIATATISVGTYDHTTAITGFTFPTIDYEEMVDLAGPTVEGVAHTAFGHVRGFEDLVITISNPVETFKDSNVDVTGEFIAQKERIISVGGRIYVDSADDDAIHAQLKALVAPTDTLSLQLGTAGAAALNAMLFEVFNLQPKDIKYGENGDFLIVELGDSKATGLTAGTEFQLTMN
ncbi:MAG: hypothetical protein V3V65_07970 [Hyphomicrobium sp.]